MTTKSKGRKKARAASGVSEGQIKWGHLFLGLLSGWYGAKYLSTFPPHWWIGLPLHLFAAWQILQAFPLEVPAQALKAVKENQVPKSLAQSHPLWLLAIAVFTMISIYSFRRAQMPLGWVFLGGAAFFTARLRMGFGEAPEQTKNFPEKGAWISLMALAALMRFPFIGQNFTGLQNDEANNLYCAIRDLQEPRSPFAEGWSGTPSFPEFLVAPFLKVFGISLASAHLASVFFSMLTLVVFYRLCRLFYGGAASAAATLLFSFAWWNLFFSFSPFHNVFTVLFEVSAFYFAAKALKEGKRMDFWWAGFFTATSVMSYLPGRLVPVMILLFLVSSLLLEGRAFIRAYSKHLVLAVLAALWIIGPYLYFILANPGEFFGRSGELSIFSEVKRTGDHLLPLKTFGWTIFSFFSTFQSVVDDRFGIGHETMVDLFSSGLGFVGLVLCLLTFPKRASRMCLIGFGLALCANAFAINGPGMSIPYINGDRFFLSLPFVFWMAARCLNWVLGMLSRLDLWPRRMAWAFLILGFLGSFAYNVKVYYFDFRNIPSNYGTLGFTNIDVAELYRKNYPSHHIIAHYLEYSMVQKVINWDKVKVLSLDETGPSIPIDYKIDRKVLLVFPNGYWLPVQEKIKAVYPNAVWSGLSQVPGGTPFAYSVEISKEDIQKSQAGLTLKDGLL